MSTDCRLCFGSGVIHNWQTDRQCPRCDHPTSVMRARFDVERRDARDLRGEPPSMEGWVLW